MGGVILGFPLARTDFYFFGSAFLCYQEKVRKEKAGQKNPSGKSE
jgi:hypothetical protein